MRSQLGGSSGLRASAINLPCPVRAALLGPFACKFAGYLDSAATAAYPWRVSGTAMPSSNPNQLLRVYAAAIFLSAALLFAVQPMFTKMVLPRLGGTPAVWSIAMVFFQLTLLAGYAYAHALVQAIPPPIAVGIHLVVLIAAALTLPLAIAPGWGVPPESGQAFWLLAGSSLCPP